MEDPWANAWGEPSKSTVSDSSILVSGSSTWAAPSVSAIHGDHEDDLSTSSWSVPATPHWSDTDAVETSIWTNDVSSAWAPASSTFDRISLGNDFPSESETQFSTSPPENAHDSPSPIIHSISFEREDDPTPALSSIKQPDTAPRTPLPPTLVLDDEIEAFGTFETGEVVERSEEWIPPRSNFNLPSAEVAALAPRWDYPASAATDATHDTIKDLDDAWERARQEKENQDRYVPRELLSSILRQVEEMSDDIWPDVEYNDSSNDGSGRADMEDLGLNSIIQKLAPDDLTLPPKQPFQKTFTFKQSTEALKLTRHSPLTKLSPMAFYMSSKGLTSWEASVKAKPNITADDFAPPGWKIVETPKAEVQVVEGTRKKSSGGFLSFFGRRLTTSSSDIPTIGRSASPVVASGSGASSIQASSSPRPSIDSTRPGSVLNEAVGQTTALSPVVPVDTLAESAAAHVEGPSMSKKPSIVTAVMLDNVKRESTPSPSAVSRFLGRFSRHKSSSSRDSLSLSADDLEFLSDVPTVETKEETSNDLDALSRMIKSPPLPTALPPPLAPPPRAPLPSRTASIVNTVEASQDKQEYLFSNFEDVPTQSVLPLPPAPILGSVLTPPVKPTSLDISASATASNSTSHPPHPATTQRTLDQPSQSRTSPTDQGWPSFDYPLSSMSKTTQTKRPIVAIMASSSSTAPSSVPPLLPKPTSAFSIPPPPSSSINRPVSPHPSLITGSGNIIVPLPPPPSSRSHTPSVPAHPYQARSQPTFARIDDDDDFADFLSSPAQPTNPVHLSFADFKPSAASSSHPIPSNKPSAPSKDLFGNFGSFDNPPRPPAKPLNLIISPSSPPNPPSKPKNGPPPLGKAAQKTSRAPDHSRTLSLMETAAARGRWLGPPSPLPEALPPPSTSNGNPLSIDPFEGGSSMQAQQARATAALSAPSTSIRAANGSSSQPQSWNFPPPMNPTVLDPIPSPPSHKPQPQTLLLSGTPNSTNAPSTAHTGGLSAQDLSFFEGL
ncbi:hypothetical protein CPB84DRAFT_1843132 [Gymnopilus junonius]|uniref:Uncharacterized protein n=1 Tax=Gymnopilus junonius TaxID=109634 RepID=A0A9P5NWR6_GYMJU|nr:hypothetical protein CPB84DRAFT_1843132 [Gymnopilus junonius]